MDKYYHRTNNLDAIASSGRVKALKHLARSNPDLELDVEPGAGGRNLGGLRSNRERMSATDAYAAMRGVKDVDNVFLSKEVLPSESYGKYVIEKDLKNPKFNTAVNLIANEYTTGRELSVRNNATVYVPDEELSDVTSKYKGVNFRPMNELKARQANLADHARTLFGKITKKADIDTLYSGSESDIRGLLGRNATIVGSEGIGINVAGASDRDILVPYKTRAGYNRLEAKLRDNGFGLQESEYNDRKRDGYKVYSFKDDTRDVDVALVHGGKSSDLAAHVRHLRNTLSDEKKQEIISEKERLQNAWFFKDTRYKNYKRGVDKKARPNAVPRIGGRMATITNDQIREYLADSPENNHLIDGLEFTNARIDLAKMLAVDSYNTIPPTTLTTTAATISNTLMLYGVLWHLYTGQMALAARNQMSYSDGGLTIPIEERYQFYVQMAQMYEQQYKSMAKDVKVSQNMEAGWGSVQTDYASFPIW